MNSKAITFAFLILEIFLFLNANDEMIVFLEVYKDAEKFNETEANFYESLKDTSALAVKSYQLSLYWLDEQTGWGT